MANELFRDYPAILYTFDDFANEQIVTDIFRRILISKELKENSSFFERYEVFGNEKPEEVSYRFYGTQKLHWLILMVNEIIDPRFSWPISEEKLLQSAEFKYGGKDSIFSINRAKNSKELQVETFFLLTEDSTHKKPVRLTYELGPNDITKEPIAYATSPEIFSFDSNYEVEQNKNEENRNIRILKPEILPDIIFDYKKAINL